MIKNFGKSIVVMIVAGMLLSTNAFAAKKMVEVEDNAPQITYENMLSTNVYPWLIGFFNLGYERALSSSFSIRPRASYWSFSNGGSWNLYTLGIDAYFHPMGKGLAGWFLGPRYDAWILSVSDSGSSATGIMHLLGGMAGYNWVFDGGFSIGISLGAQAVVATTITTNQGSQTFNSPYTGFLPAFNAEIGWAF